MPTYQEMPTQEVRTSRFNPVRRIDHMRLTGLLLSVREHGILEPLALAHDLVLADGHRRHEVAKMLALPMVPVAIYHEVPLDAPALWVTLNSDTLSLSPSQWLAAVEAGLPLDTPGFPETLKSRINQITELLGKEGVTRLVEQNRSPMLLDAAQRVSRYCQRRGDEAFLKKTVHWMIGNGSAFGVRAAMAEEIPADLLSEAIENDEAIRRVWDIAR